MKRGWWVAGQRNHWDSTRKSALRVWVVLGGFWLAEIRVLSRVSPLVVATACCLWAAERHEARGIVLKAEGRLMVVSCEAIPGYMDAMAMEFAVRETGVVAKLKAGDLVEFSIVTRGKQLYAENVRLGTTASFEAEPMAAGQLTALNGVLDPAARVLAVGERVPDFALTDQAGNLVRLSQLAGKVVVITFGYSRCPNPNYCLRLSTNLAKVEKRLRERAGRDLVFMTIMIDPEHDQGPALAEYAAAFKAVAGSWYFLTGPLGEIKQVAGRFGVNFWSVEGLLTHSLHTVILDRSGRVAVNLEGNGFTPGELGDLVLTVMEGR